MNGAKRGNTRILLGCCRLCHWLPASTSVDQVSRGTSGDTPDSGCDYRDGKPGEHGTSGSGSVSRGCGLDLDLYPCLPDQEYSAPVDPPMQSTVKNCRYAQPYGTAQQQLLNSSVDRADNRKRLVFFHALPQLAAVSKSCSGAEEGNWAGN